MGEDQSSWTDITPKLIQDADWPDLLFENKIDNVRSLKKSFSVCDSPKGIQCP